MGSRTLVLAVLVSLTAQACADYQPRRDWVNMLKAPSKLYAPQQVDWASMPSACQSIWRDETRLRNFVIRAVFHDAMAVNVTACLTGDVANCGGANAGNLLNQTEMDRFENQGFTEHIAFAIRTIAMFYGASTADTLAFCGAIAIEQASNNRFKIIGAGGKKNFLIGRVDSTSADPANQLLSPVGTNTSSFADFWLARGLTLEEGVALMGSHANVRPLGCSISSKPGDDCDSLARFKSVAWKDLPGLAAKPPMECTNPTGPPHLRMFRWWNDYYKDACTPLITSIDPFNPAFQFPALNSSLSSDTLTKYVRNGLCGFNTMKFRQMFLNATAYGQQFQPVLPINGGATWKVTCNDQRPECHHRTDWPYTSIDAYLGQSCQGQIKGNVNATAIGQAMKKFAQDQAAWDQVTVRAYLKMVNNFVVLNYPGRPSWLAPIYIDGRECPSGYVIDDKCGQAAKYRKPYNSAVACAGCATTPPGKCDQCCRCYTAFKPGPGGQQTATRPLKASLGVRYVAASD